MHALKSVLLVLFITTCSGCMTERHDHDHEHSAHVENEYERGPHGGRLLKEGTFALELQIFEDGVPPHYRAYAFDNEDAVKPNEVTLTVTLQRLGKEKELFHFEPVESFLTSAKEVSEPHSFDVEVRAHWKGTQYEWSYPSYEGRTNIADSVAALSGIKTERVSGRTITKVFSAKGKIVPSEHKIAHIIPRFPGVVREGRKHIGDTVAKGEVMAIIESNQSLQPFEVRSQIGGTVINGHLILGEFVPENQWVFIVADLTEVWADFSIPLRERGLVTLGQEVTIVSSDPPNTITGEVSYIAPYADERSQTQLIRVVIQNDQQHFLPGMFVTGEIVTEKINAPMVVRKEALQTFRDWQVVFAKVGETYEIRPLTLGEQDGEWVQVLSGIALQEEYVTENSFLIKADIMKSGASHDH